MKKIISLVLIVILTVSVFSCAPATKKVGADYEKIITESEKILSKSKQNTRFDVKKNPYGDGFSSARIEKLISEYFKI